MIAFGAETTSLTLRFRDNQREQTAKIQFGGKDKKKVWLNKVPLESQRKLAGSFYAVVFAPAHLSIISEGPKNRRKFLDSAISQINPQYADYLTDMKKCCCNEIVCSKIVIKILHCGIPLSCGTVSLQKSAVF